MTEKPSATDVIALNFDGEQLALVRVKQARQGLSIENWAILEDLSDVKPLDKGTLARFFNNDPLIITALPTWQVITRSLDIKLKKEKDVDAAIPFQAEPLLPYPLEEAIIDRMILNKTNEGTQLTLLAARKDHLAQHLSLWQSWQIEPESVTCQPAALTALVNVYYPSQEPLLLVHLNKESTSCLIIKDGKLLASQSLNSGWSTFLEASAKDNLSKDALKNLQLDNLNSVDTPYLIESLERWRLDCQRTLLALQKQTKSLEIPSVILTGHYSSIPGFDLYLSRSLQKSLIPFAENALTGLSNNEVKELALPIGIALGGLSSSKNLINFRQGDFDYPHPWKRYKWPLLYFGMGCAGLTLALLIAGQSYIGWKEDQVRESYANLLALTYRPYDALEKKIAPDTAIKPLKELSLVDLQERLNLINREVDNMPELFALLPAVPRVSDILAWLSTHPALQGDTREAIIPARLDNFSYILVKRPEQNKKNEKYQVKVELEFSSPAAKQARAFHDALIAPNDFVDPKGEVKWNANRGVYRTSFFLKDLTRYPAPGG